MPEFTSANNGSTGSTSVRSSKYVLVVGNDATSLVYQSLLVQRFEYHICPANTAEEALDMARAIVPALIIADLNLSGMNAAQMIDVLRKKQATAKVPVIFKLEQLTPQIEQKCREAGAAACLKKPVDPEELFRVVQAIMEPVPREHIRIQTRLTVFINNSQLDSVGEECATVLSSRGMYIRTKNPYPAKTKFPIQIMLDNRLISAEAKVIYSHADGEGPFGVSGMGLYFMDITQQDQELLQQYINEEVMKGKGTTPGRK